MTSFMTLQIMKYDEEVLFASLRLHEVSSNSSSQCNLKIEINIVPNVLRSIA